MNGKSQNRNPGARQGLEKQGVQKQGLEKVLLPILIFAPAVTLLCWTAAWVFRDDFVFKATLIGLGCFTIVVGAVACLLVLVKRTGG
ncbi:hypothetical protein BH10PSE10_BH10PSE10_14370 [soil metagenome]